MVCSKQYYKGQLLLLTPMCSKSLFRSNADRTIKFYRIANIVVGTDNVSDPVPAIRIKTKEGVSFEVFSNASTEVLKYLIKVVTHAE